MSLEKFHNDRHFKYYFMYNKHLNRNPFMVVKVVCLPWYSVRNMNKKYFHTKRFVQ